MNISIRVSVLTVSDRCSQGMAEDVSGRTLKELIAANDQLSLSRYAIVPDDSDRIQALLREWSDSACSDVILTTGGTGFSSRDVTPEATKQVIEREAPGIAVALITGSLKETPFAMTSRLTAGIRRSCLIVNFPGSPKACRESFDILQPVLHHCVTQLRGDVQAVLMEHEKMSAPQIVISLKSKVDSPVPAAQRDRISSYQMIDVEQAMDLILREAGRLSPSTELVPLTQLRNLMGRALAVDLKSNVNIPPWQASVKDGYAVQAVDGAGVRKVMIAPATAGTLPNKLALTSGYCIRISTGAPIPIGADAVVQVEDTQLLSTTENGDEREILITTKPVFGQDIRVVGADVRRGEVILKEGCILTPVELGLIASVGFKEVPVVRPPTVGILSTGDEIISAGQQATPGKIWDSNKTTLAALLTQRGVEYMDLGISRDDSDNVYNKLVEAFDREVDVLITTGSVSMGERDVLKRILEVGFDASVIFGRVNMKPGKPMSFLTCDWKGSKKLVFALPGNPVSAFVTCFLFVIPAINSMSGRHVVGKGLKARHRILKAKLRSVKPLPLDSRPEFVRGVISFESDFPEVELIPGNQCSSRLMSVRGADVLVCLPSKSNAKTHVLPGEHVTALFLC